MKKNTLLLSIILLLAVVTTKAQYLQLYDFSNAGLDPNSSAAAPGPLTPSVTGDTLFGTTETGGKYTDGSVFYIIVNGDVYDTLISFSGTNGYQPTYGKLVLSGNVLYGMTGSGGASGLGNIYSIHTDGTHFTDLLDFSNVGWGKNGWAPYGSLALSSTGVLFGTTNAGGKATHGNIFRINTDGSHFDTLHSFGYGVDGSAPYAGLVLSGKRLYGTTAFGGTHAHGTVFAIDSNGANYDTLHNFGATGDGKQPGAGLLLSGNVLYGTASTGGRFGDGTVFSIHTDGSAYDTLHSFGWGTLDGVNPASALLMVGNVLYGTAEQGAANGYGSLYSVHTDGTAYDTIHNFGVGNDGQYPSGDLAYDNGILVGSCFGGGSSNSKGSIYVEDLCVKFAVTGGTSTPDSGTHNGTATVTATGDPTPYTYSWSPGGQTTAKITGLSAGTYTCIVYNAAGCGHSKSVVVNSVQGINNIAAGSNGVSVYPNPSNGIFTVEMNNEQLIINNTVEVYNMLGERVYSSQLLIPNSQFLIDLSSQPEGIYFYRVISSGGNQVAEGKLVIQK